MKKTTLILLASLLLAGAGITTLTAKTDKTDILNGTTLKKYRKPGAPVDIEFTTQRVQSGEVATIDIQLITTEKQGNMQVKIKLDKALSLAEDFKTQREITLDGSKTYPLEFKVIAPMDGVYHIRLLVEMKNKGFRAFVIPVQIGNGTLKLQHKPLMKNKHGENISVSHAYEKIHNK